MGNNENLLINGQTYTVQKYVGILSLKGAIKSRSCFFLSTAAAQSMFVYLCWRKAFSCDRGGSVDKFDKFRKLQKAILALGLTVLMQLKKLSVAAQAYNALVG